MAVEEDCGRFLQFLSCPSVLIEIKLEILDVLFIQIVDAIYFEVLEVIAV